MVIELDDRLNSLIAKVAKNAGITTYKTAVEAGSAKGDNYLGNITKITLTDATNSNKTMDLIMKTASAVEGFRSILPIGNAFTRERDMYTKVLTTYNDFLKEYKQEAFDASPILFAADTESIPEVLIMNDMKAKGYVMKNRREPLDIDHVRLVMKVYGKFHGLYYALKELQPEKCEKLTAEMRENFFSEMKFDTAAGAATIANQNEKVMKALLDEDVKAKKHFAEYCKDTAKKFVHTMQPGAAGRFAVINHGDSWVNNMLFFYDNLNNNNNKEAQKPSKICLLDFQLARVASPALDLTYFIFTCTDKALRDKHFDAILDTYHDSMRNLLNGFQLDVEKFLTRAELDEQLRQFAVFGIHMTIGVAHLMLSEQDEVPDLQAMKLDGDDKENADMFTYVSKNEHKYMERMRGVIIDAADRDYI